MIDGGAPIDGAHELLFEMQKSARVVGIVRGVDGRHGRREEALADAVFVENARHLRDVAHEDEAPRPLEQLLRWRRRTPA